MAFKAKGDGDKNKQNWIGELVSWIINDVPVSRVIKQENKVTELTAGRAKLCKWRELYENNQDKEIHWFRR